jgi:phospholipid/cholesterol/gamma-HCH transport system substrate-binding protein
VNPVVGASARPNEITYSEDRLNPRLPQATPPDAQAPPDSPLPAEVLSPDEPAATTTDPNKGLSGLMVPPESAPAPPAPPGGTP